jgi:ketosteroid isomerase-like protein
MPRSHAEKMVRRVNTAFNKKGIEGWRAALEDWYDPDIDYQDAGVWPGGGAHHGRAAVIAHFEGLIEAMGMSEVSAERFVERGEWHAWISRVAGRSPGAGVPHEHRWVGRVVGGRLVYLRAYYDAQEALDALQAQGQARRSGEPA